MEIVKKSKVGVRGQIVMPKILRKSPGHDKGSDIIIKAVDDEICIRSAKKISHPNGKDACKSGAFAASSKSSGFGDVANSFRNLHAQ